MLRGEEFVRIRTNLPRERVQRAVEDALEMVGCVEFYNSSEFRISGNKFSSFATDVHLNGYIRKRKDSDEYTVTIFWSVAPSAACWIIGIVGLFLCLVGPVVFVFPLIAKGDVQRAVERALRELKDSLGD
jgi:hypothetical protein